MSERIREDFDGGIWAHRLDEHGRTVGEPVWLAAGDLVPDGVTVAAAHLDPQGAGPQAGPPATGGGEGGPGKDTSSPPAELPFDPDELTVDEVNTQLEGMGDETVRLVIDAELAGRARHGIVAGPAARRLQH